MHQLHKDSISRTFRTTKTEMSGLCEENEKKREKKRTMELFCPSAAAEHEQLLKSSSERAALHHALLQKPADE